jgi:hypothetical protein
MNKYEYKQAMNKIKWENKRRGIKCGKKELIIAQDIVMAKMKPTPSPEGSGSFISKENSQPSNLGSLLGDLGKILKVK